MATKKKAAEPRHVMLWLDETRKGEVTWRCSCGASGTSTGDPGEDLDAKAKANHAQHARRS